MNRKKDLKSLAAWLLSLACLLSAVTAPAFAADAGATREYTVSALVRAAELTGGSADTLSAFTDGDKVGTAYAADLATAVANGVINGYDDNTLRPQGAVRRAEALAFAARCLPDLEEYANTVFFYDMPRWARKDVNRLSRAGVLQGKNGDLLGANDILTTAQVDELAQQVANCVLLDRIEAANSYDALMARHSSVALVGEGKVEGKTYPFKIFASPDILSQETPGAAAKLIYKDIFFHIEPDDPDQIFAKLMLDDKDMEDDVEALRAALGSVDTEERVTKTETSDGTLRVEAVMDYAIAVEYKLSKLGCTYRDGDTLKYVCAYDAATYELQEESVILCHADGSEEQLQTIHAAYDTEFDKDASLFATYFNAEKLRKLTLTYAPGTEFETTKSYAMAKEIPFYCITENGAAEGYYLDPDCTQEHMANDPDDYSDVHYYIPLKLDKGTTEDQAKLKEWTAGCDFEHMMARHSSVAIIHTKYDKDKEPIGGLTYADKQTSLAEYDGASWMATDNEFIVVSKELPGRHLAPEEEYSKSLTDMQQSISPTLIEGETAIYAGEVNDQFCLITEVADQKVICEYLEKNQTGDQGYTYQEGMKLRCKATFDLSNGDVQNIKIYLCYPGSEKILFLDINYFYDGILVLEKSGIAPYFELAQLTPQRTITVVWAVGTAEEKTVVYQLPQGVAFTMTASASYTDPGCTQKFDITSSRLVDGITLYVKAGDM